MAKSKGLIVILAILFITVLIGYLLVRFNPNYPDPEKVPEVTTSTDAGSTTQYDWLDYTPPSKAFKVKLPALPQTTSKTFTDPKTNQKRFYEMYVSEKKDGTVFLISIINFGGVKPDLQDEDMLSAVANDMLTTHPDNKLIKTEPGKFKGNPSLRFKLGSEKAGIDTLTFIIDRKLYVLNRVSPGKTADLKEFEYFINSFDVTPRS